jgi:hypothetical protein
MLFKMKKTGVDFGTKKHGSAFCFITRFRSEARRGAAGTREAPSSARAGRFLFSVCR